jgi:hypothetical protein
MKIKECPRCGKECRAEKSGNQSARPLRKSDNGLCLECAATSVIMSLPSGDMFPKEALLAPHIRTQFEAVLRAGNADSDASQVDWNRLVENWELPFPRKFAPDRW